MLIENNLNKDWAEDELSWGVYIPLNNNEFKIIDRLNLESNENYTLAREEYEANHKLISNIKKKITLEASANKFHKKVLSWQDNNNNSESHWDTESWCPIWVQENVISVSS